MSHGGRHGGIHGPLPETKMQIWRCDSYCSGWTADLTDRNAVRILLPTWVSACSKRMGISMHRYLVFVATFLQLAIASKSLFAFERSRAYDRPNIVFIMADDLGYGDLGCYGQTKIATPRIDRLAREGTRFTDCYAGSTVCAPSRCALMTGLHTGHCTVRGNKLIPLEAEAVTVAELLKSAGYVTGMFGKWGLGEPDTTGLPTRQGFDSWFGYLNQRHAHNYYPTYLWRNEEQVALENNLEDARGAYSPELCMQAALEFLNQHRKHPFFLYVPMTLPHANNELGRETGNGMEIPSDTPYGDRDWPQPQKNHAAMITLVDAYVGQIVDRIDALGLKEKTLVFFTSDNGPHREGGADPKFFGSSGPLRGIKRDLYEGGIRVPMIVRMPGVVAAGRDDGTPWAFWDFLPTVADIVGAEAPADIDGISLWPTIAGTAISGSAQNQRDYLYWEFHERGFKTAVRSGRWKAVRTAWNAPVELYDLVTDLENQGTSRASSRRSPRD